MDGNARSRLCVHVMILCVHRILCFKASVIMTLYSAVIHTNKMAFHCCTHTGVKYTNIQKALYNDAPYENLNMILFHFTRNDIRL